LTVILSVNTGNLNQQVGASLFVVPRQLAALSKLVQDARSQLGRSRPGLLVGRTCWNLNCHRAEPG
jgi:hypothetical protein